MNLKGSLKILSKKDLGKIHSASLEILEDVGVRFTVPEARDVFLKHGFKVDDGIIKFKPKDIEIALKNTPSKILRKGLSPERDVHLGDEKVYFAVGSLPIWVVDSDYTRRKATYQDLLKFTSLAEALPNFAIGNGVVQPQEIPHQVMAAVWNRNATTRMTKPACCWYATDFQEAEDGLRILEVAAGGSEELKGMKTWAITVCPDSALQWGKSIIGLLTMAKAEVPIEILPMPFCGSTHPVTIAGTLTQGNAETLAAIVLAQLINPGCPVIYAPGYAGILDMAAASHSFGAPESALHSVGFVQLGKLYRLPTDAMMGVSDSKVPDGQAMAEKLQAILLPALAGADCITQAGGLLDFALSASYEQLVIDNETVGQVQRILRGFEINKDALAVNIIKEAGIAGNYISSEHTYKHFREEFYFPFLFDRTARGAWEEKGRQDLLARAKEKASQILASYHFASPLDSEKIKEIDQLVQQICEREGVKIDWK